MSYALITGASKGIGKAIACNLAARKKNLLLVARSEDLLKEISTDLSNRYGVDAKFFGIDLTRQDAAECVFDWVTKNNIQIDMLINNAGYGLSGSFEKYTAAEHAEMMNVNMIALVKLTSLFLPLLKQQSQSYIMNIASSAAYQAVPYLSTYAASKSFVLNFSRALQHELRKTNISVSCISPGGTDTNFGLRANISKRAMKAGEKVNMDPGEVADIAVKSMMKRKREVIVGAINKLGAFMVWLVPKSLSEKVAGKLYE
jgi:short-subunit dehydrogenase